MTQQSPDLRAYVDLTVFDREPEDIFEVWRTEVQTRIPGYEPVETNTEVVVAEALALELAEEVFAINRLPSATIEGVLRLFGVLRDDGAAPTTTMTFRLGDTAGHTIPAGTRAALILADGLEPVVFATDFDLVVPAGASTGTAAATGDRLTADANGYPVGTLLELLDAVSFAESVTLGSQPADGRDAEDQQAWLSRGITRFARLSATVSGRRQFEDFALERGIYRAYAVDLYDPTRVGVPGDFPGHVTLAVYGQNDVTITPGAKAELRGALDPVSAPHLIKHIVDPTVTAVDVTATVSRRPGFDDTQVAANAEKALREHLSPNNWPWAPVVRRTKLITTLAAVEGVADVASVTVPAADVALPGVANLTRPGTVTVVVVAEGI